MYIPIYVLVVIFLNILFMRYLYIDQKKHSRMLQLPNGTFIETPSIKATLFAVAVLGCQIQLLPVITDAVKTWQLMGYLNSSSNGSGSNHASLTSTNGNFVIKSEVLADPDYIIKLSHYDPGQYEISLGSKCTQELIGFIKRLDICLAAIADSNGKVLIKITGQADGLVCKGTALYRGVTQRSFDCYSLVNERSYRKKFIPNQTRLKNEDYARLRAYNIGLTFISELHYNNVEYKFQSNITNSVGSSQRWVEITIIVPEAFKRKYEGYNIMQKKVFDFVVNI